MLFAKIPLLIHFHLKKMKPEDCKQDRKVSFDSERRSAMTFEAFAVGIIGGVAANAICDLAKYFWRQERHPYKYHKPQGRPYF